MGLSAMAAGTIETVTVGNPNNDADGSGYGAVGCQYNIGKHEASAGQYAKSSAPSRRPTPAGCTAPPWIQRAISPAATLSGAARRAATRTAWRATSYRLPKERSRAMLKKKMFSAESTTHRVWLDTINPGSCVETRQSPEEGARNRKMSKRMISFVAVTGLVLALVLCSATASAAIIDVTITYTFAGETDWAYAEDFRAVGVDDWRVYNYATGGDYLYDEKKDATNIGAVTFTGDKDDGRAYWHYTWTASDSQNGTTHPNPSRSTSSKVPTVQVEGPVSGTITDIGAAGTLYFYASGSVGGWSSQKTTASIEIGGQTFDLQTANHEYGAL